MFEITCAAFSDDVELFTRIVNRGIDSRLEAFTKSVFSWDGSRLVMKFHDEELQILLRRLEEDDSYEADMWIDDILSAAYGVEE